MAAIGQRALKREKEMVRAARLEAKHQRRVDRRAEREQGHDYRDAGQFPSAWPGAPEPVADVARTLSRGF